jgi:O-antigen/teichoic acid export membrane protein
MPQSLKKQALTGIFWTFSQQFSVQMINIIVQIILARILLPEQFGLIAMVSIFFSIGNALMDSGLTSSLIRTPNAEQKDYSTVFFINLIGSLVIYIVIFFLAPFIASFYSQSILKNIIRLYSLSFIIQAFMGVQAARLTKELKFKLQMVMQLPSVIIGGTVGIILALHGYGVWSLVWLSLTNSFFFTLLHWVFSGWRPVFDIDRPRLKYHFQFGYKLTLSGILNTLFDNAYNIIIGKLFSATQLGFYNRADTLQKLPVQNISTALNKVTYPMFAEIQNDDIRLKMVYKRIMQQVLFLIAPVMIILILIAKPLFHLLLTDKWLPAVPYFQILCVPGIFYPLHAYNLNILNVKGRSDLFLKLEVFKKIIIVIGIFGAFFWGIYGLLWFQVIFSLFSFIINSWFSGEMINYNVFEQAKNVSPIILISVFTGILTWLLSKLLNEIPNAVFIISATGFYLFTYILLAALIRLPAFIDFRRSIFKI